MDPHIPLARVKKGLEAAGVEQARLRELHETGRPPIREQIRKIYQQELEKIGEQAEYGQRLRKKNIYKARQLPASFQYDIVFHGSKMVPALRLPASVLFFPYTGSNKVRGVQINETDVPGNIRSFHKYSC